MKTYFIDYNIHGEEWKLVRCVKSDVAHITAHIAQKESLSSMAVVRVTVKMHINKRPVPSIARIYYYGEDDDQYTTWVEAEPEGEYQMYKGKVTVTTYNIPDEPEPEEEEERQVDALGNYI